MEDTQSNLCWLDRDVIDVETQIRVPGGSYVILCSADASAAMVQVETVQHVPELGSPLRFWVPRFALFRCEK